MNLSGWFSRNYGALSDAHGEPKKCLAQLLEAYMRLQRIRLYALTLCDRLPVLPLPLITPDPDADLDLAAALNTIDDEAFDNLSVDYNQDPPPLRYF